MSAAPSREHQHGLGELHYQIRRFLPAETAPKDLREKYALYEKHGVKEYWVVDPAYAIVTVYRLAKGGGFSRVGVYTKDQKVRCGVLPRLSIDP